MARKTGKETKPNAVQQLAGILDKASQADFDELQKTIEAKERELDALEDIRRILANKLGIELPKRGPGGRRVTEKPVPLPDAPEDRPPKTAKGTSQAKRELIAVEILKGGPATQAELARLFDIPDGSQTLVFRHEWFGKLTTGADAGKTDLTEAGHKAANRIMASQKSGSTP